VWYKMFGLEQLVELLKVVVQEDPHSSQGLL